MDDRPDLVLFMTDQQRFDQVGYASDGHFETPALDRLAGAGAVFDTAYSASTTCVPARSSLLTGIHHHRLPRQHNGLALEEGFWTVAHALRAAGYETALVGKMHFMPVRSRHGFEIMRMCEDLRPKAGYTAADADDYHDWLLARGLADWREAFQPAPGPQQGSVPRSRGTSVFPYDAAAHPTGWIEREARTVLAGRDRTRPLFLVVSFPNPHAPYNPAEPYASRYDPADARLPADGFEVNEHLPPSWRAWFQAAGGARVGKERGLRTILTRVRALIRHIDDALAAVVADLDLARSTVFFTSDHGDYAGHRGLVRKTPWIPFDDLARVPLVAAGAGVRPGARLRSAVQSVDLAPTLLDLAGVDPPSAELDGRSLVPLLAGRAGADEPERAVYCATSVGFPMVRRGDLKYVADRRGGPPLLFDLAADPGEQTSVQGLPAYGAAERELGALLERELARGMPDLPCPPLD